MEKLNKFIVRHRLFVGTFFAVIFLGLLSYPVIFFPSEQYRTYLGWPGTLILTIWIMVTFRSIAIIEGREFGAKQIAAFLFLASFSSFVILHRGLPATLMLLADSQPYTLEGTVTEKSRSNRNLDGCRQELRLLLHDGSRAYICVSFSAYADASEGDQYIVFGNESWVGRDLTQFSPISADGTTLPIEMMPTASARYRWLLIFLTSGLMLIIYVWFQDVSGRSP